MRSSFSGYSTFNKGLCDLSSLWPTVSTSQMLALFLLGESCDNHGYSHYIFRTCKKCLFFFSYIKSEIIILCWVRSRYNATTVKKLIYIMALTSLLRMPYKPRNLFFHRGSADVLTRIPFFASLCGSRVNTPHVAVTLCRMTCIHANVSWSPWEHGSVAPDKRHCRQWMSSLLRLFCGFLPNPFIHDLFLWRISQEFVPAKDLYPLSLMSLRYAVCSNGHWSIIGRCFGACQRSSCAEERRPQ